MAATEDSLYNPVFITTYADLKALPKKVSQAGKTDFAVYNSGNFTYFRRMGTFYIGTSDSEKGKVYEHSKFGLSAYKLHVNINIEDIDKTFEALYPLITAADSPVIQSKIVSKEILLDEHQYWHRQLTHANEGIERWNPEPDSPYKNMHLRQYTTLKNDAEHKLADCEKARTGCQVTFYVHSPEENIHGYPTFSNPDENVAAYARFADKVQLTLKHAAIPEIKTCPAGDIPLAPYLSGRYELDENGEYVNGIDENPHSIEQSQLSPLFQEIRQRSENRGKQIDTIKAICNNTPFWKTQTVFGATTPDIIQSAVVETSKAQDPLITLSELSFIASNKKSCFTRSKVTKEFISSLSVADGEGIECLEAQVNASVNAP